MATAVSCSSWSARTPSGQPVRGGGYCRTQDRRPTPAWCYMVCQEFDGDLIERDQFVAVTSEGEHISIDGVSWDPPITRWGGRLGPRVYGETPAWVRWWRAYVWCDPTRYDEARRGGCGCLVVPKRIWRRVWPWLRRTFWIADKPWQIDADDTTPEPARAVVASTCGGCGG